MAKLLCKNIRPNLIKFGVMFSHYNKISWPSIKVLTIIYALEKSRKLGVSTYFYNNNNNAFSYCIPKTVISYVKYD